MLCVILLNYYVHNISKSMVIDNINIFNLLLAVIISCPVYWKTITFDFLLDTYVGHPESKERLRIQSAQLFNFS